MGKCYHFIGEGAGVPGLPHELTEEGARALGVEGLLQAALANGNYVEITPTKEPGVKPPKAASQKAAAQEGES
jgi:hypothetical protein